MNLRQQQGIKLAAQRIIRRQGNLWIVPSQTGDGTRYTVDLAAEKCSCPDYQLHRRKCKHIFAAHAASSREHNANSAVIEKTVMATRPTFRQNWSAYNLAQTTEKDKFQKLLYELCAGLPTAPPRKGRPPVSLGDAVFAATFKVYSTLSGRRFMSDLREAHRRGWISRVPCYNTIFNILESDELFETLRGLVVRSALPLRTVEVDFAPDSTGFSTSRMIRWVDVKSGKESRQHDWVKVHATCGVKTNIVTAIEIGEPNAADTKQFPPMLATTAKNFKVVEISADKAYISKANFNLVDAVGAKAFISFPENSKVGTGVWAEMFGYFMYRRDEFLKHYHKRSNIESTFSMIKRKFGDGLRSRTDAAMKNEAVCKFLCHNIAVVIQEMHELGIETEFWGKREQI